MRFPAEDFDDACESAIRLLSTEMGDAEILGKPTLLHSVRVGMYLYVRGHVRDVCLAGLLHDALEDTDITREQIERQYGEGVARMVQANTKDESIADYAEKYADMMRRCVEEGEGAAVVKAADILDNIAYCRKAGKEAAERRMTDAARTLLERVPAEWRDPVFEELRLSLV